MAPERKLTAILSADVVGYSRLMADDEPATVGQVKAARETMTRLLLAHGGRVVDAVGDNLLAELPSIVEAVRCAVAIQDEMVRTNEGIPEERRMRLRIGVNLGDVIVDEGRIYGDGVNVAARVEALAEPGGVALSGAAFEHVGEKLDLDFEDLGEHPVKNVPRPIRVYGVRTGREAAPPSPSSSARGAIAVLPFENMSGDPEQEYFADGIAEDLLTRLLSRGPEVIARNSSFAYRGRDIDVRQVGRELGARYVLEGSVRRSGSRVRITAQLVDAGTGHHIWGEKYDRELGDIFRVQDEITTAITSSMGPTLWKFETERAARRDPQSLDAWESMQRASWHAFRSANEPEHARLAKQFYERAVELDPELSDAWGFLSTIHYMDLVSSRTESAEASREAMFQCAQRAVSVDPLGGVGHLAMAMCHNLDGKRERALASIDRAIELFPNWSEPHALRADYLSMAGDFDGAIEELETYSRLNPRQAPLGSLAVANFSAGRYEETIRWAERERELRPQAPVINGLLAASYAHTERLEEARERVAVLPEFSEAQLRQLLGSATPDFAQRVIEGLRRAGWRG